MFKEDLKHGEQGEYIVWNILSKDPQIVNVLDVRGDKRFQGYDVDFLAQTTTKQFYFIEVKTDFKAQETNNIVYEVTSNSNEGCFARTKADYVYYYIPEDDKVLVISVTKIRDYIDTYMMKYVDMGDGAKGYLVNIDDLKQFGGIKKVYEGVK